MARIRRFSARRELTLGVLAYAVYLAVGRIVLRGAGRARARRNAERIVAVQQRLGIDVEPRLQQVLLRFPRVVHGLNVGYAAFNVTLTAGWLVRLFRSRDPDYHRLRTACLLAYAGAQPIFLMFPAEPPRVLDGFGYVDTLSEVSGFDLEHPTLVRLYNPVAAMPSLHVAFAVLTGAAIGERADTVIGKAAAHSYAPFVALVVAATGNHYVLDAVGGAALGAVARSLSP